eukprot:1002356-Lingulodinium_polyedra.AAC.1
MFGARSEHVRGMLGAMHFGARFGHVWGVLAACLAHAHETRLENVQNASLGHVGSMLGACWR